MAVCSTLSLLLLCYWAPQCASSRTASLVSTGERFAEEIIKFAQAEGTVNTTLEMSNSISLESATWKVNEQVAGRGFSSGSSLTVRGASEEGHPTVLDAAMKAGLAPRNTRTAITWENIVFVNLCSELIVINPSARLIGLSSSSMYFLPRSRNTNRKDCTVYISRREFLGLLYWIALESFPSWDIRNRWATTVLEFLPATYAIVRSMDEHSISIEYMELPGGADKNITYRTTSNSQDPFGIALPEFGGSLMPHRLCSPDGNSTGPLLSEAQVKSANFTAYPVWLATSSTQFLQALNEIMEHSFEGTDNRRHRKLQHLEMVFILNDISLASGKNGLWGPGLIPHDALLHGSLSSHRPILNFADNEGVLSLGAQSRLFIRNMVLTGLKPVAVRSRDGSMLGSTCLKLVAIHLREGQHVQVVGVTLQVPNYEFLVLLSAANRGAHWQDGASTTAFLLQNVEVFEPKVYNRSQLLMSRYTGWSVNGHDIMFVPMSPLAESDKLLDQDFLSLLENSNKGNEDSVALGVGIGVGVGVGTLLLIASSCLLAIVLRRKRKWPCNKGDTSIQIVTQAQEEELEPITSSMRDRLSNPDFASTSSKRQQASAGTGSPSCTKNATKSRALSTKEGLPADIAPVQEVEVDEDSMPIQRIVADQGDLFNPSYFNMLLRQEVEGLLKEGTGGHSIKLEGLIGKGAWGAVYKGSWKGLTVAVKTVVFTAHADSLNKPLMNEARAVLEAAVCLSLSHPNIVSTYHYDVKPVCHNEDDKMGLDVQNPAALDNYWKLFLVLEYCHSSLGFAMQKGLFNRGGNSSFESVLYTLLDVAKGALYLHQHQIIHGDIKPDNILLKADATSRMGWTAKISDFGMSTKLEPTASHASNHRLGTPFYCAPEVATDGHTTKASDVFSFGVVMSELCSGAPPFQKAQGDSNFEINPAFPYFPSYVPGALKDLALRCMDANISERPNFVEIVSSLQAMEESIVLAGSSGVK